MSIKANNNIATTDMPRQLTRIDLSDSCPKVQKLAMNITKAKTCYLAFRKFPIIRLFVKAFMSAISLWYANRIIKLQQVQASENKLIHEAIGKCEERAEKTLAMQSITEDTILKETIIHRDDVANKLVITTLFVPNDDEDENDIIKEQYSLAVSSSIDLNTRKISILSTTLVHEKATEHSARPEDLSDAFSYY